LRRAVIGAVKRGQLRHAIGNRVKAGTVIAVATVIVAMIAVRSGRKFVLSELIILRGRGRG
jgi:hypothetical protein